MCTVIYLPQKEGFVLSSNRDENPNRKANPPQIFQENLAYLCPTDPKGGTWMGVNAAKNIIILLNGASEHHIKSTYYQKSRGLIVKELLNQKQPVLVWQTMDLQQIEPFTLIVWSDEKLFHLEWNGTKKQKTVFPQTVPFIFSSSTLYDNTAKKQRKEKFEKWLLQIDSPNEEDLVNFLYTYQDTENGYIMNRNEIVRTISVSTLKIKNSNLELVHRDLLDQKIFKIQFEFNKNGIVN
jgi:uncharacterized protein with NRDE domain